MTEIQAIGWGDGIPRLNPLRIISWSFLLWQALIMHLLITLPCHYPLSISFLQVSFHSFYLLTSHHPLLIIQLKSEPWLMCVNLFNLKGISSFLLEFFVKPAC